MDCQLITFKRELGSTFQRSMCMAGNQESFGNKKGSVAYPISISIAKFTY